MNHNELRKKALQKPAVARAYGDLAPEFQLLKRMLSARIRAGLNQSDVAKRMGTKPPAIVRLEKSLSTGAHSPSVFTLTKYAAAVNCRLDIKLIALKRGGGDRLAPTG